VGSSGGNTTPPTGPTDFESAPPGGSAVGQGLSGGAVGGAATGAPAANAGSSVPPAGAKAGGVASAPRTVQETDLYRLDGNRLYYLNGYRGLMVFDVSVVDNPKLLGRYGIFGTPVQMIVNNGLAVVVVADWYGTRGNGQPFHGSIVEGLDASAIAGSFTVHLVKDGRRIASRFFFQESLFFFLLAGDAITRPRHRFQAFGIDLTATIHALAKGTFTDPLQRSFHHIENLPLIIADRK